MKVTQRLPDCAPRSTFTPISDLRLQQLHYQKMYSRRYAAIAPAIPKQAAPTTPRVSFYDLPAELRVEIYRLALSNVIIHILPPNTERGRKKPAGLSGTTRQVRNEVLPIMHTICPISCAITDFNFEGLLEWLRRIPPDEQGVLCKNSSLTIRFHTSLDAPAKTLESLRKWLHIRADKCRPQPKWEYTGVTPAPRVASDLKRRAKRMKETGKQGELLTILKALKITCYEDMMLRGGGPRDS